MTHPAPLIVAKLGEEDAATLSRVVGGTWLSVPRSTEAPAGGGRHGYVRLVNLLGDRLAAKLILHFAELRIYIPHQGKRAPVDAAKVRELTRKGRSAAEIARELNCSIRTVHSHRSRKRGKRAGKN